MHFLMAVTTKGNETVKVVKFMPHYRLAVNPILFVMNL